MNGGQRSLRHSGSGSATAHLLATCASSPTGSTAHEDVVPAHGGVGEKGGNPGWGGVAQQLLRALLQPSMTKAALPHPLAALPHTRLWWRTGKRG